MNSKVYVCSPLRAKTNEEVRKNIEMAKNYCKKIGVMTRMRAIAPHTILPDYFDDNIPEERELCVNFGLKLLEQCEMLFVCGEHISRGMAKEISYARKLDIPIFYYTENGSLSTITAEDGTYIQQIFPEKKPVGQRNRNLIFTL